MVLKRISLTTIVFINLGGVHRLTPYPTSIPLTLTSVTLWILHRRYQFHLYHLHMSPTPHPYKETTLTVSNRLIIQTAQSIFSTSKSSPPFLIRLTSIVSHSHPKTRYLEPKTTTRQLSTPVLSHTLIVRLNGSLSSLCLIPVSRLLPQSLLKHGTWNGVK